jgi:hypothetical protein
MSDSGIPRFMQGTFDFVGKGLWKTPIFWTAA